MSVPTKRCPSCSTGPMWARRPELDARGVAGDVVVPPDQAAQPVRQRVDEALAGDNGRYHDQGAVAAVFAEAVRPGMPEPSKALCRTR